MPRPYCCFTIYLLRVSQRFLNHNNSSPQPWLARRSSSVNYHLSQEALSPIASIVVLHEADVAQEQAEVANIRPQAHAHSLPLLPQRRRRSGALRLERVSNIGVNSVNKGLMSYIQLLSNRSRSIKHRHNCSCLLCHFNVWSAKSQISSFHLMSEGPGVGKSQLLLRCKKLPKPTWFLYQRTRTYSVCTKFVICNRTIWLTLSSAPRKTHHHHAKRHAVAEASCARSRMVRVDSNV